ncbi:hypothetical protein [Arthrobacter celericrescens]|uniref:hypothetical protein n=1 Tax=Arthrobacter celericrescens TaxID=2320851 RepID=UPI000EA3708E|nr:hypothetical protein [Arthrobacter celericrescens]
MYTVLTAVMLACCAVGVLCPLREGRRRGGVLRCGVLGNFGQWGPMAVMLAAMADTTAGPGLLPGVVWALLLLLAAPLPLVLLRREHRSGMELHRALSVLGMFALLVTGLQPVAGSALHSAHAHQGGGGFTPFLAAALAAAVAGYSVLLAMRGLRSRRLVHPVEAFSSAGALGAMLLMAA